MIFITLKRFWPVFLWIFLPGLAGAGEEGIPLRFVFFQIFNFCLFAGILVYLLRGKLPAFLQQKRKDFLDYRTRAKELEEQYQLDCASLEKELLELTEKEKNIESSVAKALETLRKELTVQEKQSLETQKKQANQEIKRQRIKELGNLKNRLLSLVLQQTKIKLKEQTECLKKLNDRMIQKEEWI